MLKIWKNSPNFQKNHKIEKWKPLVQTGSIIIESHYLSSLIFFENNYCSRIHIPNPYLIVLSLKKRELPNFGLNLIQTTKNISIFRFYNIRNLLKFSWKFRKISQKILTTKKNSSRNFPKFSQIKKKFYSKKKIHRVMVTSNCIIKWRAAQ